MVVNRLKTIKLGNQNCLRCRLSKTCELLWICSPIIKNEAMNNIEPSFTSPKVVGMSPKMPPVGLFCGESNMSIGSHKIRTRLKLSL